MNNNLPFGEPVSAVRTTSLLAVVAAVLLVGMSFHPAAAQSPPGAVTPYTNASDLRDIAVDADGMFWIASNGGALRFDPGTGTWAVFPKLLGSGPRGNDLVTVAVDALGRVWTGSATRGFTFYDPSTGSWDRLSEEWPDPRIRVIRAFGTAVYIGTQDGLSLKPTPSRTDICAEASPSCIVPSYLVNDYALMGDTLWVATQAGLGRYNGETWDSSDSLPAGSNTECLSLAVFEGTLWAATTSGVRRLADGQWQDAGFSADRLVVSGGRLHAINGKNIISYTQEGWVALVVDNSGYGEIRDLVRTEDGFYLATDVGLVHSQVGEMPVVHVPPGPPLTEPYAGIAVDSQGRVWAGTQQGRIGLVRFDGGDWTLYTAEDGLDNRWIFTLLSDIDDNIWVGHCCCTSFPDCRVDVKLPEGFLNLDDVNNVWGLDQDPQGRIWAATDRFGTLVLENQGGEAWDVVLELTQAGTGGSMSSNFIRTLAATAEGAYIGNYSQGIDYWAHGGNLSTYADGTRWVHIGQSLSGLLDANVGAMAKAGNDVWVGTSSGLHRFRDGIVQERCPTKVLGLDGDQPRSVRAIAADRNGGLWVGTNNGLLFLSRDASCTATGGEFILLNEDNSALPSSEIFSAALNPVDGSIWVGTGAGIARVDPSLFSGTASPDDRYVLYPNPFRIADSASLVHLGVQSEGRPATPAPLSDFETPEIFDLTGRKVGEFDILDDESWTWNGRNLNGDALVTPGLYLVRARQSSGEILVLKLGVLR